RHFTPHHATVAVALANQAAIAMENVRLYTQARDLAAVQERQRLARDLHDAVTQTLFSASLIAEVLPHVWERDPERARYSLQDLRDFTRGALAEMRTLLLELRPASLTQLKLSDLLQQLTEAMSGRIQAPIQVTVQGDGHVPDEVHIALYRIVQEALNNIARHARAAHVTVALACEPDNVRLAITDDGRGFDPAHLPPDHFGVRIMRERAETIGATLELASQPGGGTRVTVAWTAQGTPAEGDAA
ncbi:MAG TPA: sensor histidine kinase, partial [Herpetosiphonaceae bacterium]|nr:sensor histidine kinase [Herpetosiphonaceae bacterium]